MVNPGEALQASSPRTSANCWIAWTKRYVARSRGPELLWRRCRATGAEMRPIHSGTSAERGKPVVLPAPYANGLREREPQGEPTGPQVKEEGGSESRAVMARIGVEPEGNITPRESGQTSRWSGVTREPGKQTSGGDADMSVAATPAGAAPDSGNTACLPQASIVKVPSGKRRRAGSVRFDRAVVHFCCTGGSRTPPTADREATAHQGRTGSDSLPRGGERVTPAAISRYGRSRGGRNRAPRGVFVQA